MISYQRYHMVTTYGDSITYLYDVTFVITAENAQLGEFTYNVQTDHYSKVKVRQELEVSLCSAAFHFL